MKAKGIAILAVAAVLITGWNNVRAQQSDKDPYEGVLTGTNVHIRSGPSRNSYPVAKISKPAKVTVMEKVSDEWLAIKSAPGCYSVISAKYVKPDPTGKIGAVTGDGVQVRAAGRLRHKDFLAPQGKLNKGDAVRIIGTVTDKDGELLWYIIKPPSKVRFYISSRYVKPAGALAEGETIQPPPPDATVPPKTAPPPTLSVSKEMETLREIRKLEKELVAESKKPLKDRNFKAVLTRAEEIDVPRESRFRSIYDSLIVYIKDEMKLLVQVREADKLAEDVLREASRKRKTPDEADQPKPRSYDIQGILNVSVLPGMSEKYVLRNPKNRKIQGYVQSTKAKINLLPLEGKNVGIKGITTFDRKLAMRIIEVEHVDILGVEDLPAPEAPLKPKPVEPKVFEPKPVEPPAEPKVIEPKPVELPTEPKVIEPKPVEPPAEPKVIEPKPVEPPAEPKVIEPKPVEPPAEPKVIEPKPVELPTEPKVIEPKPVEPPAEPKVIEPKPVEPPAEPKVIEPKPVELPTEPKVIEPKPVELPTEPKIIEPKPVEPPAEPKIIEPKPVELPAEPKIIEPKPVEPPAEPKIIKPKPVEPPAEPKPMKIPPLPIKPTEMPTEIKPPTKGPKPVEVKPLPPVKPIPIESAVMVGEVEVEWD